MNKFLRNVKSGLNKTCMLFEVKFVLRKKKIKFYLVPRL